MNTHLLGWPSDWQHLLDKHAPNKVARITQKYKTNYRVRTLDGQDLNCFLPGRFLQLDNPNDQFAVGDWCILGKTFIDESNEEAAYIEDCIERKSKISRAAAGPETRVQVLAANVDIAFIVTSANGEFNINRLRRYVLLATNGNTQPVIVLSKIDLIDGIEEDVVRELKDAFPNVECMVTSSIVNVGVESILERLGDNKTAVFVGTSGVGKSSLVNALIGENLQKTNAIKADDKRGRHTTTASTLVVLPTGGMIIDTPGLREVGVVGDDVGLEQVMPGVAELAGRCKFANCTHTAEPQCAVQAALESGDLSETEFAAYEKFERELAYNRRRFDERLAAEERNKWKKITILNRQRAKHR